MKTYQELNEEQSKLARSNEQLVKSLSKAREQIVQLPPTLTSKRLHKAKRCASMRTS